MDLQQRMTGKLPEIDIAGTMFFVEVHWGQLRSDFRLLSTIKLDQCDLSPDGEHYRFSFNTETKQMVMVDPDINEWPKNVVLVEIPNEVKLDPYSLARKHGIDPVEFVKSHPFEKELKAKIVPIEETGYFKMIKENNGSKEHKLLPKKTDETKRNKGKTL